MTPIEDQEKINILLVDDQPAKLISYEVMLNELNESLIKASSAQEAFEHLLKNDIAVVLIDVCMPELDGFELASMIRGHPRFERTAIIFVSAIHMADDDRLRGYRMGAVDYMPVPVIPDILRAKVKVFAELYRKTRQLEQLNAELERRVAMRTAELEASNSRLVDSEKRRSVALSAGHMGSWDWDLESNVHHWDEEHFSILGIEPATFRISVQSIRRVVHPDDWPLIEALIAEAKGGRHSFHIEARVIRPDSEIRWCSITAAANFDGAGRLVRVSGVTLDITERKNTEERHALLAREVDHRAKNALALVQSILRLTKAETMQGYVSAVEGRISALAHAHTLLSESRWQGADIRKLMLDELAPYEKTRGDLMLIEGPSMTLQPETAQSLALVVHELATNSAKYGSLSSGTGKLAVKWWEVDGRLHIDWTELDGPPADAPGSKGFGIRVITLTIENQLQGKVDLDWAKTGLHCRIAVPHTSRRRSENRPQSNGATHALAKSKAGKPILLVEDEVLVGMALKEALREMGIETLGPFGGVKEALAAAHTNDISAAVLDVSLGDELVYEVADFLAGRKIPFVFVTGYSREGIDARFDDVPILCKPVDHGRLCNLLQNYTSPPMPEISGSRTIVAK